MRCVEVFLVSGSKRLLGPPPELTCLLADMGAVRWFVEADGRAAVDELRGES